MIHAPTASRVQTRRPNDIVAELPMLIGLVLASFEATNMPLKRRDYLST